MNAVEDIASMKIDRSKLMANGAKYFELFEKHIPTGMSGNVLIMSIGNLDCLDKMMSLNKDAKYTVVENSRIIKCLSKLFDGELDIEGIENDGLDLYNIIKELDMKFDCIVMNPPYGVNRNHESNYLHYYITEIATSKLTKTGICVSLMPISLISSTSTKKELLSLKDRYDEICCSIEQVDQSVFPDTNMKETCIYTCKFDNDKSIDINCNKLKATCSSLHELNYGMTDIEKTILSKLQSTNIATTHGVAIYIRKKDRINSNEIVDKWLDSKKLKDKEYFICMSYANGGMNAMWQSTKLRKHGIVLRKNIKQLVLSDTTGKAFLCFTKSEFDSCKNVFKLLNSNCLRFGLAKMQTDQNIQTKCYKYFPDIDYSLINSENDFYKFFNITSEEQKVIEDTMEKYASK